VAPVRAMFESMAPDLPDDLRVAFENMDESIRDEAFMRTLQERQPGFHALTRNTCSITMLTGSDKINVVPPTATAELDCRILPDQDAAEFLSGIRARIADEQIEIEEIMLFGAADSSPDTDLFRTLEKITLENYPGAGFMKSVSTGFTDSHFFRDLGIISYGYSPIVLPEAFRGGVHGNNERIGIAGFEKGIDVMIEILTEFAGPAAGKVTSP
jgi:acetylornithine deacetylase/succinyl-diaminopimelate desuccinylase-like protein